MTPRVPSDQALVICQEQREALFNSSRELHAILSSSGNILYASGAFRRVLGYEPEELLGQPLISLVPANDVAVAQSRIRELAEGNTAIMNERCRLRAKDGSCLWFEVCERNARELLGMDGIVVSCLEISALHRMEAERQVISDVVHALNQTSNLDQLLERIHQALKNVMYAENCFVALYDTSNHQFTFPFYTDQFDTAPAPQRVDLSCTSYVFRTGHAMLIPQREFDRLALQGEVELVGSPSPAWLGVPLKTPTATIGVLVVQHYQDENAYDMQDLEFLDSVGGQIAIAIERRRSEEATRKSESMFRLLFTHNPLPTWVIDVESLRFLQVNDAAVRQYGYSAEEFAAMTAADLRPDQDKSKFLETWKQIEGSGLYQGNAKQRRKDGKTLDVEIISHELDYAGRKVRLGTAQDITERRLLEDQLRQAQKMEAVGRLAGGVAHDFNNLLMVIKGHTELLLNVLPPTDHVTRKIEQIDRSADRAAALTRQLLAFSRMQVLQPRVIHLNNVVAEMGKLLPRLIGEDIDLEICTPPDLGMIRADASQMEQVIMNLAVNARDAMPNGGRLLVETANVDLDYSYSMSHPVLRPGRYVLLAVSDSGVGMDAETQAHIFEPFFTTKEQGKGTGLGLATVYGVVKQSGGFIWVYSEVGKGTCFKIYLPRVDESSHSADGGKVAVETPRGTETVLLAEDERDVREVAREFLESGGYQVIEAKDGAEAMRVASQHEGTIDLLVTDMIMPGMTGIELAGRLQQQRPSTRVIFMSGYSEQAASQAAQTNGKNRLLTKPFSRNALLRAVRDVLNTA